MSAARAATTRSKDAGGGDMAVVNDGVDTFAPGDVNGDGTADLNIQLTGVPGLDARDFVL